MESIVDESVIKYFCKMVFISIFTMYLNYKFLNIQEKDIRKMIKVIIQIILIDIISIFIEISLNSTIGIILTNIFLALLFSGKINKNVGYSLMITMISFCINYILYSMSIVINYIIFKTCNINNDYIILLGILLIYSIIFIKLTKIKRLEHGIVFFRKNEDNEALGLVILNLSTVIFLIFAILTNLNITTAMIRPLFIYVIIFSIILFITIQKTLQLYYKQKLQERETAEIKEELNSKAKEIEELEKENLRLSKANHSILHKQKSLEYELSQALLKNETIDKKEIKTKLQDISKEIPKETAPIELTKTNIKEIDNMLKYMQAECTKNKIDFELQINGNIHHMINKYIGKEELEILLADHIKNAIIAINHSNNINKNILVRIGIIDGLYSLYIYDSGIEFEVETLKNLGIKPSTTHADDGGTGMGFMNTFDTLKKYNASMEIHEYGKPSKDNFTKVVKIIFNNKHEYKISSYREKEIL